MICLLLGVKLLILCIRQANKELEKVVLHTTLLSRIFESAGEIRQRDLIWVWEGLHAELLYRFARGWPVWSVSMCV